MKNKRESFVKMKKVMVIIYSLVFTAWNLFSQQSDFPKLIEPYLGQKPPGLTPELFAPGIVSTGLDELNSVFSPDGKEFYFCVRKPGAASIFQMKLENGIWSKPVLLSFASRFGDIDVSISPDGSKLFFSSRRPVSDNADPKSDYDFWMVDRVGYAWSEPFHLGANINSDRDDFYPMITNDGNLYFSSQREGLGTNNIYCSKLVNGHYLAAEKLDSSINSTYRDFDSYISPDESLLIFASARPGGFGAEDLYISFRKADGNWTTAKNMGDKINSQGAEFCPMLSQDGKFLFFTGARRTQASFPDKPLSYQEFEIYHNQPQNVFSDIYWVDAKIIDEFKPNK